MASPAWLAATVQEPAAIPVTTAPFTLQIFGVVDLKLTSRPEVAVALTVVVLPTISVVEEKLITLIVWLILVTVMFFVI